MKADGMRTRTGVSGGPETPATRDRITGRGLMACALLALPLAGCRERVEPPAPLAVRVERLASRTVESALEFSGTVRERARVSLSFKVPGTVARLHQVAGNGGRPRDVQEGDRVSAGTPLAWLDDGDYVRRRDMARERVGMLRARIDAARATADQARRDRARVAGLAGRGAASREELEREDSRLRSATAELTALSSELGAAEIEARQAEDDLAQCVLPAPLDATLASRSIEPHERIAAGQAAFALLDDAVLKVVFGVPDTMLSRFAVGQAVQVRSEARAGEPYAGRVSEIAPLADEQTRTFPIEVTIDAPGALRPGMIVTVRVGRPVTALRLPLEAIQPAPATREPIVFEAVREGQGTVARARKVALDGIDDDRVVVRLEGSEVRPGASVVVVGADRLHDGRAIRVLTGDAEGTLARRDEPADAAPAPAEEARP
jgi:RND family efflux transporter MFP subunit